MVARPSGHPGAHARVGARPASCRLAAPRHYCRVSSASTLPRPGDAAALPHRRCLRPGALAIRPSPLLQAAAAARDTWPAAPAPRRCCSARHTVGGCRQLHLPPRRCQVAWMQLGGAQGTRRLRRRPFSPGGGSARIARSCPPRAGTWEPERVRPSLQFPPASPFVSPPDQLTRVHHNWGGRNPAGAAGAVRGGERTRRKGERRQSRRGMQGRAGQGKAGQARGDGGCMMAGTSTDTRV